MKKVATAFAPATVANVAVGFDVLGFALKGLGEYATVIKLASPVVEIEPVLGFPNMPLDPLKNTATAGLVRLIAEKKLNFGFKVRLKKEIPIGSGLGGSSTSAVAALIAANALLTKPLTKPELLDYALTGEAVASGARHADNIGPCLEGGLVFAPKNIDWPVRIKTPASLRCVILLPDLSIQTKDARLLLKPTVPLANLIEQTANLAGFIIGCQNGDFSLIQKFLADAVIEPQRAALIPNFYELKKSALTAGALGCSLSGSGPALFALVATEKSAQKVLKSMRLACKTNNLKIKASWVSALDKKGAHLVRGQK